MLKYPNFVPNMIFSMNWKITYLRSDEFSFHLHPCKKFLGWTHLRRVHFQDQAWLGRDFLQGLAFRPVHVYPTYVLLDAYARFAAPLAFKRLSGNYSFFGCV